MMIEDQHDMNEKMRRQNEAKAKHMEDPEMRRITLEYIAEIYEYGRKRIEREMRKEPINYVI